MKDVAPDGVASTNSQWKIFRFDGSAQKVV